ncbi:MAG: class I SAM-dependent methyltransferase [Armatimonadetes bacterium]|nr:class I SAM-dependent methyltransferase [Armatimonadota bacterium]
MTDVKIVGTWSRSQAEEDAMNDEHAFIWRAMIDAMLESDLSRSRVLDFGCSQGGFLRLLHRLHPYLSAVGVDVAQESVATANARKADVPVHYQAATSLEAFRSEFDVAFSHEVLYLLPDLRAHAEQMRAALKPGGVYYAVLGAHAENPLWPRWRDGLGASSNIPPQDCSLDDVASAFRASGFAVSARRFLVDAFIPVGGAAHASFASVREELTYYSCDKVMFRLIAP